MKKLACLLLVCSVCGATFAIQSKNKVSPSVDNTSITKSKKAENHQIKEFQSDRHFGKIVKGHGKPAKQPATQKPGKGA